MNTLDKVGIWNLALSHLGVAHRVATDADISAHALACKAAWAPAVETVLRAVDWPFAEKRVTLTLIDDTVRASGFNYGPTSRAFPAGSISAQRTDWAYTYILPYDLMKIRELCPAGTFERRSGVRVPFTLGAEYDSDSGSGTPAPWAVPTISTNLPEADLIYTSDATGYLSLWDPMAIQAVSYGIASIIAWQVGKPEFKRTMIDLYKQTLSAAAASALNEVKPTKQAESEFTTGRF